MSRSITERTLDMWRLLGESLEDMRDEEIDSPIDEQAIAIRRKLETALDDLHALTIHLKRYEASPSREQEEAIKNLLEYLNGFSHNINCEAIDLKLNMMSLWPDECSLERVIEK